MIIAVNMNNQWCKQDFFRDKDQDQNIFLKKNTENFYRDE